MKHLLQIGNDKFYLSYEFKGETSRWGTKRNFFNINVSHKGKEEVFIFYDSFDNYLKKKISLTADCLIEAFCCILRDAMCSAYSVDDFCCEFGYEDREEAEYILLACKKIMVKLNNLSLSENQIRELLNSKELETYI